MTEFGIHHMDDGSRNVNDMDKGVEKNARRPRGTADGWPAK